jgi:hypothetical protein
MKIEVDEGYDVAERAESLGVQVPKGLAILPRNFAVARTKQELVYDPHVSTLRKLWREAGLQETGIELGHDRFPRAFERSADWIGPTVFIASLLVTQNPYAVQIALGIVQEFASDLLRRRPRSATVKLEVIVETKQGRQTKRVRYEGDVTGLTKLVEVVDRVSKGK